MKSTDIVLCSERFNDQGLRLDAAVIGVLEESVCPNCGLITGRKLNTTTIEALAYRFFVWGTQRRFDYGAAPRVAFNEDGPTSIRTAPWLKADLSLFEKTLNVGFFDYGPPTWMGGEVSPLKALKDSTTSAPVVDRIMSEYPTAIFPTTQVFYRVRKNPSKPSNWREYDSPPAVYLGSGRLDSSTLPVMYASPDLQVCLHECRVSAKDDLFVATLAGTRDLRLLDLTHLLQEPGATDFESLDMAVHMLFLAGEHAYDISRGIAIAARSAGYDGLVYPSYFSLLRTGAMPFEAAYGISLRRIPQLARREKAKIVGNLALFGRPIEESVVKVEFVNRVILNRVEYGVLFGPVAGSEDEEWAIEQIPGAPGDVSGRYVRDGEFESAELEVIMLPTGKCRVSGTALWGKTREDGPLIGELDAESELVNNRLVVRERSVGGEDYQLALEFQNGKLTATEVSVRGHFGQNVSFSGEYRRIN